MREIFSSIRMDEGILSAQAAQQIQALIRTGELRDGEHLPSERDLGDRLRSAVLR